MIEFVLHGIFGSLFFSLLICLILAVKKLFSSRLTAGVHYYLWFVPLAGAAASFFPGVSAAFDISPAGSRSAAASALSQGAQSKQYELPDLFVNAPGLISRPAAFILFAVWLAGIVLLLFRILYGSFALRRIYKRSVPAPASIAEDRLRCCQRMLHMKRSVQVRISGQIKSPAAAGIVRPCILLPASCMESHLNSILLHELVHCKHMDAFLNLVMQLFFALNWHNPFVWYAVRQMETDRELCCDSFVLAALDKQGQLAYGRAIIDCAAGRIFPAVGMKTTSKALYKRIAQVSAFHSPSTCCRRISRLFLAAMLLGAVLFAPPASSLTEQSYRPQADMNIHYEDLGQYFGNQKGCFVLYDKSRDTYTVYNREAASARVSPNSTYKIYSALFALDSGFPQASYQTWDGSLYPLDAWNKNQDLNSAMRSSVNWYFQNLDQKSGKHALQEFYDSIGYGNCDLSGGLARYWMESSLKISPMEQVILLAGLYENKWKLRPEAVSAVKASLQITPNLFGKTGTGMVDGKTVNGWFIGYTETPSGPQIFALNLQDKDGASGAKASEIAQKILSDKGLL